MQDKLANATSRESANGWLRRNGCFLGIVLTLCLAICLTLSLMLALMSAPFGGVDGLRARLFPIHYHYPPASAITSATTLRTSDVPSYKVAAFSAKTTNIPALRRFYGSLFALKRMPPGTYFCPVDTGVYDHIAFYAQGKLVLQALIDEQGCGWVNFGMNGAQPIASSPSGTSDTRSYLGNAQFWPLFAAAFNANPAYPETDLSTSGLVD